DGARHAGEAEAGQLLAAGYADRATAAATADATFTRDQVAAALVEARTARDLLAAQVAAVTTSVEQARASLATAVANRDQVLALPQGAPGVAAQAEYVNQVVAAAQVSVDRSAAALASIGSFTAPVDDAVLTLTALADRLDPAASSTPLPDVAAVYALGGVVLLGVGVAGVVAAGHVRTHHGRRRFA
ncbi:MAG: hypothetical protein JWQ53_3055, partial [Klenkia sp.]|nr:hypothetical protein [Klenkia sp.]